jgi:hypothetical protein
MRQRLLAYGLPAFHSALAFGLFPNLWSIRIVPSGSLVLLPRCATDSRRWGSSTGCDYPALLTRRLLLLRLLFWLAADGRELRAVLRRTLFLELFSFEHFREHFREHPPRRVLLKTERKPTTKRNAGNRVPGAHGKEIEMTHHI